MRAFRPSSRGAVVALLLWFAPSASGAGVAAGALAMASPQAGPHRVAVRPCADRGFDVVLSHGEDSRAHAHEAAADHPAGIHVEAAPVPSEPDHVVRCVEADACGTPPRGLDLPATPVLVLASPLPVPRPVTPPVSAERGSDPSLPPGAARSAILRI